MLHLYANYRAVKALNFKTLNKERMLIILHTYLKYQIIENSDIVNKKESVILGSGITGAYEMDLNVYIRVWILSLVVLLFDNICIYSMPM